MRFNPDSKPYTYEVQRESGEEVLYINYNGVPFVPSLSDSSDVMSRTVDVLVENPNVSRVVFSQSKNYNYDFVETSYLLEIAQMYVYLLKQENVLSSSKLVTTNDQFFAQRYNDVFSFLLLLKGDPIAAHSELKRLVFEAKISAKNSGPQDREDIHNYAFFLEKILALFEKTKIIKDIREYLPSYKFGDRGIYHKLFKPDAIPNFTFTRLVLDLPDDSEIIDQYKVSINDYDESIVTILQKGDDPKPVYHVNPPENSLSEEYNNLLNLARGVLMEHQPKAEEFTDINKTRQVFFNIAKDLISDLAQTKGISLDYNNLNKLATILVRHTIGFGLMEVVLQDKKIQDMVLNAPIPMTNIFLRHEKHGECSTNILPSQEDVDSWAAKFRMISGRPLDEANPIMDTQLGIGKMRARIAVIQRPLSPDGLAYAIRRHRDDPWTLPLFVQNKMINPLTAGLLSFLVDGARTMLIAGTRSSGKTSMLGSLLQEISPQNRIICIEDSLELPAEKLREMGYNILRMKVRSALANTSAEVSADDGIRTSLRLGDSCLIIGEVRSAEAKALYEAMRVGALANVVAGTIHGASPYGVFDRVVNDLNVPATSFKATDIIAVCNPIKSADGGHSFRRMVQIAEVRKHWKEDPMLEGGFVNLLDYNVEKDEMEPTADLINGDSEIIKDIASNVKGWAGNWDAVYDNILLRAKIKKHIVETAEKIGDNSMLEARFNALSNHKFHTISREVRQEIGLPLSEQVYPRWQTWLNSEVKKRRV